MSPALPFPMRCFSRALLLCASLLTLGTALSAQELHLLPQPREIKQTQSSFAMDARTRIVVARTHAAEDTVAAEMLAEEIALYTGRKPAITVAPGMPAVMRNVIYLADRKSTRLNSSHIQKSRMPSSA